MKTLIILFLISINLYAHEKGNGGNTVLCEGSEMVVLDYFHAKLPSGNDSERKLLDIEVNNVISEFLVQSLAFVPNENVDSISLFKQFKKSLKLIPLVEKWINTPLNFLNDHGLVYPLPKNCKLLQAAIRKGSSQYGDFSIINQLSKGQKQLLRLHEVLYEMLRQSGYTATDSSPIRELIRVLLKANKTQDEMFTAFENFKSILDSNSWTCSLDLYLIEDETNYIIENNNKIKLKTFMNKGKNPLTLYEELQDMVIKLNPPEFSTIVSCTELGFYKGNYFCKKLSNVQNSCFKSLF